VKLHELASHCMRQISLQSEHDSTSPVVLLVVPGSPHRRTAASGRRRLCPGGPLGEIVSSVESHDNVLFNARELLLWCKRKATDQQEPPSNA
jgi:hypothetical protein